MQNLNYVNAFYCKAYKTTGKSDLYLGMIIQEFTLSLGELICSLLERQGREKKKLFQGWYMKERERANGKSKRVKGSCNVSHPPQAVTMVRNIKCWDLSNLYSLIITV